MYKIKSKLKNFSVGNSYGIIGDYEMIWYKYDEEEEENDVTCFSEEEKDVVISNISSLKNNFSEIYAIDYDEVFSETIYENYLILHEIPLRRSEFEIDLKDSGNHHSIHHNLKLPFDLIGKINKKST